MRTVVVFTLLAAFLGFALGSAYGSLIAYLWYAFFRPQDWVWDDINSLRISLILGALLVVRSSLVGRFPDTKHPLSIGAWVFLLSGLLAQTNAVAPDVGWRWIEYFAILALVCGYITALSDSAERILGVALTIALSLGAITANAGLSAIMSGGEVRIVEGHGGSFVDNNGFALAAVMVMPILVGCAQCLPPRLPAKRVLQATLWLMVVLTAYAAIATFSRGGLLALIAVVITFIMAQRRFRVLSLIIFCLALGLAGLFIGVPEGYSDRMGTILTYDEIGEDSANSRLHFWRVAWNMARENPLGVGMFNYQANYDAFDFLHGRYGSARAVHSSHFQVLSEQGFLGLFTWVALLGYALFVCLRIRNNGGSVEVSPSLQETVLSAMSVSLLCSHIAFVVGGSFINLALNELTWSLLGLTAALDLLWRNSRRPLGEVTR
jgi:putative inorganic carbon (HCO3(-)) transporter